MAGRRQHPGPTHTHTHMHRAPSCFIQRLHPYGSMGRVLRAAPQWLQLVTSCLPHWNTSPPLSLTLAGLPWSYVSSVGICACVAEIFLSGPTLCSQRSTETVVFVFLPSPHVLSLSYPPSYGSWCSAWCSLTKQNFIILYLYCIYDNKSKIKHTKFRTANKEIQYSTKNSNMKYKNKPIETEG